MSTLTPDEEAFFNTGELPTGLEAEAAASAAEIAAASALQDAPQEQDQAVEKVEEASAVTPPAPNEALERMLADMQAKFDALSAQVAAKAEPPKPAEIAPDEELDPIGAMIHKLNGLNTQVTELKTDLSTEKQQNLLRQQFEQFNSAVTTAKTAFEATTPDFKDAYAHIRALRADDLRAAGAPEAQINQILLNDELQLAQTAISRGKNPAAEMYAMAKRYGYTPKATQTAATGTAAQKLAILQAGQAAAVLPGKAGAESPLTLGGLRDASHADLNALVQDDKAWARIVGGSGVDDLFG